MCRVWCLGFRVSGFVVGFSDFEAPGTHMFAPLDVYLQSAISFLQVWLLALFVVVKRIKAFRDPSTCRADRNRIALQIMVAFCKDSSP